MPSRVSSSTTSIANCPDIRTSSWCCSAVVAARSRRASGEPCRIRRLGQTDYASTWRAMQAFTASRAAETPDEIWLTEHPPIYALGLAGRREHVLRDNGIPVLKVDRGGQVTYHGPGQVVVYLLYDLRRAKLGVRDMVRRMETAVLAWLGACDVRAYGKPSAPGVYVERDGTEAKIA